MKQEQQIKKISVLKRLRSNPHLIAIDIGYVFGVYTIFAIIHIISTTILSYIPLIKSYVKRPVLTKEYIWRRYFYTRIHDCWNRTVTSRAGIWMDVKLEDTGSHQENKENHNEKTKNSKGQEETVSIDKEGVVSKRCLNFGSYNYLGFADSPKSVIEDDLDSLARYGTSSCSQYTSVGGCTRVHKELERSMAKFLGKEDCFIFAMGYATNSTAIPLLISRGGLIVSDAMNHASIVAGCRESGAKVVTFKHNNMEDLERVIKTAITTSKYKLIMIIVEGIYSMEGDMCNLPEIARIKAKYNCRLYIDEAHSIGSIGPCGRGVTDYFGKELIGMFGTKDVADVLMGTFTKSFASIGGYVAADKQTISKIRSTWEGGVSMPPMCAQQIVSALEMIDERKDNRIKDLEENTRYLRGILMDTGLDVLGANPDETHAGSPVVPIRMRNPMKMAWLSRQLLKYSIGIVIVGYPAVPITENRIRLCVSSSLTKRDIDYAVRVINSLV